MAMRRRVGLRLERARRACAMGIDEAAALLGLESRELKAIEDGTRQLDSETSHRAAWTYGFDEIDLFRDDLSTSCDERAAILRMPGVEPGALDDTGRARLVARREIARLEARMARGRDGGASARPHPRRPALPPTPPGHGLGEDGPRLLAAAVDAGLHGFATTGKVRELAELALGGEGTADPLLATLRTIHGR